MRILKKPEMLHRISKIVRRTTDIYRIPMDLMQRCQTVHSLWSHAASRRYYGTEPRQTFKEVERQKHETETQARDA